jgi:hypothetical protein
MDIRSSSYPHPFGETSIEWIITDVGGDAIHITPKAVATLIGDRLT